MSKRKRPSPGLVAKKTRRFVCSKIGHAYPRPDRPFKRCTRCGTSLSS